MGAAPPYGTFQVAAQRVALLTSSGAPDAGAKNGYYTKGVVDVGVDLDVQTGAEDTLIRGDGEVCATSRDRDIIKRSKLDVNLCALDAALIALSTGALLISDGLVPMGYQVLGPDDGAPPPVCYEVWSLAWDNSVQATPTVLSDEVAYWHWVFPAWKGNVGKNTLNAKHNAVPLTGLSSVNPNITANGPFDDWPAWVADVGGITRPYGVFLDSLPTSDEGYVAVTSAAS